jgi:hypothetical protein
MPRSAAASARHWGSRRRPMKHRRTPFLLVHLLLFSAAWREGAKGNPANVQTAQVPTIPEKFVGNTTPASCSPLWRKSSVGDRFRRPDRGPSASLGTGSAEWSDLLSTNSPQIVERRSLRKLGSPTCCIGSAITEPSASVNGCSGAGKPGLPHGRSDTHPRAHAVKFKMGRCFSLVRRPIADESPCPLMAQSRRFLNAAVCRLSRVNRT